MVFNAYIFIYIVIVIPAYLKPVLKFFLHIRTTAYPIQIPLPLFPFRIDWTWQDGFELLVGTTSGIIAAYSSG